MKRFDFFPAKVIAVILSAGLALGCIGCGQSTVDTGSTTVTEKQDTSQVDIDNDTSELVDVADEETSDTGEIDEDVASDAEVEVPALRDSFGKNMNCRIGAAVTGSEADDEKVWEIITTHFNALTLGNELKPDALFNYSNSTCPGTEIVELNGERLEVPVLSFSRAEKILNKVCEWNEANPNRQIKVRGHVLVWHSQTPEWFFHEDYKKSNDYVDRATMNLRLEWYIKTVLTHFTGEDSKYKDLFYGWDVVNEAVSDSGGKYRTDSENPSESLSKDTHGNNSSWWHIYQNEEYIINAFIYANKYAPGDLELYYNDYNECNIQKQNGIVNLLEAIKAKEGEPGVGTRITAMGMQGHYGMDDPNFAAVQSSIKKYSEIVGAVQITEMDLKASSDYDGSEEAKTEEYEKQRKRYNMLYFAMKAATETDGANFTGLTFWGTVDHYSWLQTFSNVGGSNKSGLPQCPLLFDENYEPKPCFWVFAAE